MKDDVGKLILRVAVGGLMAFHGLSKLRHGIQWMAGPLAAHHLPAFIGYGVYVAEVVVPVLLILGIFTRPAAGVIVFELCMAIYLVLGSAAFGLNRQTGSPGGELQFLYILAALAIVFLGSGRLALSKGKGRWD